MGRAVRAVLLAVFAGMVCLSAWVLGSYLAEGSAREREFDALEELVRREEASLAPQQEPQASPQEEPAMLPGYRALYEENQDVFGWVRIEGTGLSYPVMFTPEDPEHYLRRSFSGEDSQGGVPFLDGGWTQGCGNYLVYGHNMDDGTMFATLLSYREESFWEEHPVIQFDTLYQQGTYQVMGAFYAQVYGKGEDGGFRYYQYTDLSDPARFSEYVSQVEQVALYPTGVEAQPGDQLLTLSTCSYHTGEGRFVVVAKQVG